MLLEDPPRTTEKRAFSEKPGQWGLDTGSRVGESVHPESLAGVPRRLGPSLRSDSAPQDGS